MSKEVLKQLHLSPVTHSINRYKCRGIKGYFTSKASGPLSSAVIAIRDKHVKDIFVQELVRHENGYELWMALLPDHHEQVTRTVSYICISILVGPISDSKYI